MFGLRPGRVGKLGAVGGVNSKRPSFALDFVSSPSVDSRLTTTRAAGGATYFDNTGVLQLASANTGRIDYGPNQLVTNQIRNSNIVGVVPGTPGTQPTNWSGWGNNSGLTQQIIGSGVESGIPYIDVRYSGTTNTTGFFPAFEANNAVAALTGQTWTLSAYFRLVGGTTANLTGLNLGWQELTSASGFINAHNGSGFLPTTLPLASQRQSFTLTNSGGGTTAFIYPTFGILFGNGVAIDITLRVGAPQLELGSVANPWVPTSTIAITGPAPSVGVTNWVRNSSMTGAVVGVIGSGGAAPTFMGAGAPAGLTNTLIGFGTESGIPYIDFRVSGTTGSTAGWFFNLDSISGIFGTLGQTWTLSTYLRLVGGSLAGITNIGVGLLEINTALSQVDFINTLIPALGGASLVSQRYSTLPHTVVQATTAFELPRLIINIPNATAVDFTLRIGAPQLELGPIVNAWTPTSGVIANVGATAKGLLIEEPRTNIIANPRSEGGVAGTPGTLPTNHTLQGTLTGLTTTLAFGTENGIPYTDLTVVGTSSASDIYFTADGFLGAVAADLWCSSVYVRLVAGTLANVTFSLNEFVNGGSGNTNVGFIPTSAGLATQRIQAPVSTIGVGGISLETAINILPAGAVSFTLRMGGWQQEKGQIATSVILPPAGTPAATARAADDIQLPIGTWYNPLVGSMFAECIFTVLNPTPGNTGVALLDDGGAEANSVMIWMQNASSSIFARIIAATVLAAARSRVVTVGTISNAIISWDGTNSLSTMSGITQAVAPTATPTGITRLLLGRSHPSAGQWTLNGWLRKVKVWKVPLNAADEVVQTS